MLNLRAYNDELFRVDEVLGAKLNEWLKFDERYFYKPSEANIHALAQTFDMPDTGTEYNPDNENFKEPLKTFFYEGTSASVKKALRAIDPGALIVEGNLSQKHDGSLKHDGARFYGSNSHWAEYSVLTSVQTDRAKAAYIRKVASEIAPVRCALAAIETRGEPVRYDGGIRYDKKFNYGVY